MYQQTFFILALIILCPDNVSSQEKLEVEGAIVIEDSEASAPAAGTIRFNPSTKDFEGWNGHQWMSLTRLKQEGDGVTDEDGNLYQTIKLGTQEWMAENLRVRSYNDGSPIPEITSNTDWINLTIGARCWYNNDSTYDIPHGQLYNYYAVLTDKLCPSGWHVATNNDWQTLTDYLGGYTINIFGEIAQVGGKMKSTDTEYWQSPNEGATNESGFNAVSTGARTIPTGSFGSFTTLGIWWARLSSNCAKARELFYDKDTARSQQGCWQPNRALSVRCVKD